MKLITAVRFCAVTLVLIFWTAPVASQTLCDTAGCLNGNCVIPPDAPLPTCNCSQGFRPSVVDANVCIDVNECFEVPYPCNAFRTGLYTFADAGICQNTIGGYNCTTCAPAFRRSFDGLYCVVSATQRSPRPPQPVQPLGSNLFNLYLFDELDLSKR